MRFRKPSKRILGGWGLKTCEPSTCVFKSALYTRFEGSGSGGANAVREVLKWVNGSGVDWFTLKGKVKHGRGHDWPQECKEHGAFPRCQRTWAGLPPSHDFFDEDCGAIYIYIYMCMDCGAPGPQNLQAFKNL